MVRAAIIAAAAAVIAGIAIYAGLMLFQKQPDKAAVASGRICFARDFPLIKGAEKECYRPDDLAFLAEKPVIDESGAEASVNLSHPTNASGGMQIAHNCAQFRKMEADGWYALSTKDMRREAVFKRACGVLAALERAQPAKTSFFAKTGLTEEDMKSLAEGPPLRFGPEFEMPGAPASVTKTDKGWRLSSDGQSAFVEEIAQGDFNADGRGDILVLVTLQTDGGTATVSEAGILEKPSEAGPVRLAAR